MRVTHGTRRTHAMIAIYGGFKRFREIRTTRPTLTTMHMRLQHQHMIHGGEGGCGHYATVDSQKQTEPMHKSPAHCMTRQKCKSTGKRHIARARSEQCTLPLQANMQHLAELPQRGDADLSLARRQDMKVPHGQPRWPQPTKTRKRDAPTSPPWTRCRCCRRSRQRPGCATGPSRWGPLMLPFGLGSKAHLSCGRPQTSEVMAVKLDSFTEAGGRGLQGGSAGKPAHLAAVEVPRRGPVREWPH